MTGTIGAHDDVGSVMGTTTPAALRRSSSYTQRIRPISVPQHDSYRFNVETSHVTERLLKLVNLENEANAVSYAATQEVIYLRSDDKNTEVEWLSFNFRLYYKFFPTHKLSAHGMQCCDWF